ncbi:uncharacterized protein LOC135836936 [Planococcus citri]|uniref:uncharacterized protein LOC135836936 n=1 Tax=Planococcus citri TaxID=170843 RepID=UPI0031F8B3B4
MIFIPIILFIGFSNFFAATANEKELPDDGRLAVGKCLDANFLRNQNRIRQVEDYLSHLCTETRSNHQHFKNKLQEIKKTPKEAYEDLKECLKKHYELEESKKANQPDKANTSDTTNPTKEIKSTEADASDKANERTEEVINRYKQYAFNDAMRANTYPEIILVVVGLCGEHEWVKYEELDKNNQPKAIECLEKCAVRLFEIFDWLIQVIISERVHSEQLEIESGKSPANEKQAPAEKSDNQDIDRGGNKIQKEDVKSEEDEEEDGAGSEGSTENLIQPSDNQSKPKEDEKTIQKWFTHIKHFLHREKVHVKYEKGIHNYIKTCENLEVHDIKTLTEIGQLWAGHYIDDLETEFNKFHFYPIKEDMQYAFNSYLHCTVWVCAMGERKDTPFVEYVNDTSYEMSRTASQFIKRFHPTPFKTPDSIDIKLKRGDRN